MKNTMKLITSKNITVFLNKMFEVEKEFISKRSELVDLINYQGSACCEDMLNKASEDRKQIMDDFKANKITREDALSKIGVINSNFKVESQKMTSLVNSELFKELEENYSQKILLNGFINEINISRDNMSVITKPDISYEKKYAENLFRMQFVTSPSEENVGLILMHVENSNKESFSMHLEFDNNNVSVASISLAHRNLYVYATSEDQTHKDFLSSLEESIFSSLDSKEHQDLSLILYDFSLDLSDESTYKVFKEGFNDFKDIMKKELAKENRITNKI